MNINPKVVCIIQARMSSTRLPGKVLMPLGGKPAIEQVFHQLSFSKNIHQTILATSDDESDRPLLEWAEQKGIPFFSGSLHDVLDRYYRAAWQFAADIVVRVTGDCPLIDPEVVDAIINKFCSGEYDYVSNVDPPTYPNGLDAEVFSFDALEKTWEEASLASKREHVTPYIRNHPELFKTGNVSQKRHLEDLRWTLDHREDYDFLYAVFEQLYRSDHYIRMNDVLKLLEEEPQLLEINDAYERLEGYKKSLRNDKTIIPMRRVTNMKGSDLYRSKVHDLIPGGAHTYSKGDDQFPALSPAAIHYGKGAHVWGIDGNEFLDCSMGLTSVSLGHAYEPVLERVRHELEKGINFQRPSYLEMETAEAFLQLLPMHDMIKFAKNGSTVTTAAVKLARAYTGRKLVAFPYDHPFYSYDDWFIGKTVCNRGVPEEIQALSVTYKSDDLASLTQLFDQYPGQIACVISEPEKNFGLPENYLQDAIDLAHKHGALYIVDEMITGFKTAFPGSITKYNVRPDMATWGKGIANGFAFCCLTGIKEVMELGGIRNTGDEKVFLISTTHGAETHAMGAVLATIDQFKKHNVIEHNHAIGKFFVEQVQSILEKKRLDEYIEVADCHWMPIFNFKNGKREICPGMRTLMMQEMIARGVLFQGAFVPCFSHTKEDIQYFADAFNDSLEVYAQALEHGYEEYLVGHPVKPVFRKYI